MIWGGTEVWLLIILGSIPPLRPLFRKLFMKARGSHNDGSDGTGATKTGKPTTLVSVARKLTSRMGKDDGSNIYGGTGSGSQEDILGRAEGTKDGIVVHSTFEMTDMKTEDYIAERDAKRDARRAFV